jgi:sulfatase maturation enzyme AslB (radical SAM superfamily)
MRQKINNNFKNNIDLIQYTNEDGELLKMDFKYIDIRFSNLCNLKCRGCSPTLSSSWYDDHQALHDYKSDQPKVKSVAVNSPNFWSDLKNSIHTAEEIYFGGGEPLITKEHYEVLRLLVSLKRYDIRLSYNTNLVQLSYGNVDLAEIWSRFQTVSLGISIDDMGKRAEYFRHGSKWDIIEKNMFKLRDNYSNLILYVNCTVNIMNVFYLPELYDYLFTNKIIQGGGMNINLLLDPVELSVQVLPKKLKNEVGFKLAKLRLRLMRSGKHFENAAKEIRKIIKFMIEEDKSELLPLFKKNTLKLDELRKESFAQTFPELAELVQ